MTRTLIAAAALALSVTSLSPALAAPCKDAKGKFIKCAPAKAAPAARCKDGKGKFVKCGTPGSKKM